MLLDRKQMVKKRLDLEEETFLSYSKRIASYLEEMPAFKNAKRIGFYMSYRHEVDTLHLIEKYMLGKEIYVPKCVGEELDFQRIYGLGYCKSCYGCIGWYIGIAVYSIYVQNRSDYRPFIT